MRFLILDRKTFSNNPITESYFYFSYPFLGTGISEFFRHWKSEESEIDARVNKFKSIVYLVILAISQVFT